MTISPCSAGIVLLTELAECQRAEGQAQIAQRHVKITRKYEQVENDADQPGCDDVSENPWLDGHPDACGDLDHSHIAMKRPGAIRFPTKGARYCCQLTRMSKNSSSPAMIGAAMKPA